MSPGLCLAGSYQSPLVLVFYLTDHNASNRFLVNWLEVLGSAGRKVEEKGGTRTKPAQRLHRGEAAWREVTESPQPHQDALSAAEAPRATPLMTAKATIIYKVVRTTGRN